MVLSAKYGKEIADGLIQTIQLNKDYLSEIDGKIGDGDHGINMNKGFTMCRERLEGQSPSVSEAFAIISQTLMEDIGGSMGPLYGVLFEGMSMASEGREAIAAEDFAQMLSVAVEGVMEIGSAQVGDKTLLDTLVPAKDAFADSLAAGHGFDECLSAMKEAASAGWRSTENMVAKIGRASRLGERSRGVLDAGATSCYLLLTALADSILPLLT